MKCFFVILLYIYTFPHFRLLSKGHRVIGVEFCEVAITEFQEEQGIVMTSRELPDIDGTVHEVGTWEEH